MAKRLARIGVAHDVCYGGRMSERCVTCGLELIGSEATSAKDPEGLGRSNTAAGPMHFGCYWKVQREAEQTLVAKIKTRGQG